MKDYVKMFKYLLSDDGTLKERAQLVIKAIKCSGGRIATYGSGFNKRSFASSDIEVEFDKFVMLNGYKRRFACETARVGGGCYLDLVKDADCSLNMVTYRVDARSMANFLLREGLYGYDSIDGALFVTESGDNTADKVLPRLDYLQAVVYGINKLDPSQVDVFLNTTYIHDGRSVKDWLATLDLVELLKQYDSAY